MAEQSCDGLEDAYRVVPGKTDHLTVQRKTQYLAGKVLADEPVAGLQDLCAPSLPYKTPMCTSLPQKGALQKGALVARVRGLSKRGREG